MKITTVGKTLVMQYGGSKNKKTAIGTSYSTLISHAAENGEPVEKIDITKLPVGAELRLLK